MGVNGLWSLLDPAGKPVPLESLENKILAVGKLKLVTVMPSIYHLTFQTFPSGLIRLSRDTETMLEIP